MFHQVVGKQTNNIDAEEYDAICNDLNKRYIHLIGLTIIIKNNIKTSFQSGQSGISMILMKAWCWWSKHWHKHVNMSTTKRDSLSIQHNHMTIDWSGRQNRNSTYRLIITLDSLQLSSHSIIESFNYRVVKL